MTQITTGQIKEALVRHFQTVFVNPNWDVIGDILTEIDPDLSPESPEYADAGDAAYTIWHQGRVSFDG